MSPRSRPSSHRGERARRYGQLAERLTLWLLWLRGFEAVAWREKVGRLELDLIFARGRELRVVEVKARARGAWVGGDLALGPEQRVRLQRALVGWLDRRPWPGDVTFQRVSWAGFRCRFHPVERWEGLALPR